jgi:hypothetical protein
VTERDLTLPTPDGPMGCNEAEPDGAAVSFSGTGGALRCAATDARAL